ncbi:anaphase-promoting complex subunit [Nannochloropsis gaditana]|uniref:Anaphase-promoting complex subunit n=2 Tax=Nannochloropsis gaditana TaxID=72520 RepID=W7TGI5_9STRA|nr:anaphase-promoting complex subunit [Nannochloropsis gaditana]
MDDETADPGATATYHAEDVRLLHHYIRSLIGQKLYDSADLIGGLLLCCTRPAIISHSPSMWDLHATSLELYADSLVGKGERYRALSFYQQANAHRKCAASSSLRCSPTQLLGLPPTSPPCPPPSLPINFKEARCHLSLNKPSQALRALLSVSTSTRESSVPVAVTLGHVYRRLGMQHDAQTAYKDAVGHDPLALEALIGLAKTGMDEEDIWRLVTGPWAPCGGARPEEGARRGVGKGRGGSDEAKGSSSRRPRGSQAYESVDSRGRLSSDENSVWQVLRTKTLPWLKVWVQAHVALAAQNWAVAAERFGELEVRYFPKSTHCLLQRARAQVGMDLYMDAQQTFGRAVEGEGGGEVMEHMDYYAVVLRQRAAKGELAHLAHRLMDVDTRRPEPWIAAALHSDLKGEKESPLTLVEQAIKTDHEHVLGYQVRGTLLLALGKAEAAASSFLQGSRLHKDMNGYKGLVDAYLVQHKFKEALGCAKEAFSAMPKSATAITLVGRVLAQLPEGREKAKRAFQRALSMNPSTVDALLALADLHLGAQEYDKCIHLLSSSLQNSGHDFLHTKLGEAYAISGDFSKALASFNTAVSMNPSSAPATAGLEKLEKLLRGVEPEEDGEGEEVDEEVEAEEDDMVEGTTD